MERFTNVFGVQHLETVMILILAYATLVYIVTERAKVLDDIHENLRSDKAEVCPTRESVYMAVPLIIARASADAHCRRRIFHAALHGLGGKRLAKPSGPIPCRGTSTGRSSVDVASTGRMWPLCEIYNNPTKRPDVMVAPIGKRQNQRPTASGLRARRSDTPALTARHRRRGSAVDAPGTTGPVAIPRASIPVRCRPGPCTPSGNNPRSDFPRTARVRDKTPRGFRLEIEGATTGRPESHNVSETTPVAPF